MARRGALKKEFRGAGEKGGGVGAKYGRIESDIRRATIIPGPPRGDKNEVETFGLSILEGKEGRAQKRFLGGGRSLEPTPKARSPHKPGRPPGSCRGGSHFHQDDVLKEQSLVGKERSEGASDPGVNGGICR